MHFEIENKYQVGDFDRVRERLAALGTVAAETVAQVDCYYRHPVRNFAQTDEAFRLRSVGEQNFMTYKGPKLDASTKSRYEREASLADGPAAREACDEILRRLGFDPVATVRKRRQTYDLTHDDQQFEIALDVVEQLGQFVEIEIQVEAKTEGGFLAAAKRALAKLAAELQLQDVERRSYLELLLATSR